MMRLAENLPSRWAISCLLGIVAGSAVAHELISAYQSHDNIYHLLLNGEHPPRAGQLLLHDTIANDDVPLWWSRVDVATGAAQSITHIVLAAETPRNSMNSFDLRLEDGERVVADVAFEKLPCAVSYLVSDTDRGDVYLYLQNNARNPMNPSSVRIDGTELLPKYPLATIPPGKKSMIVLRSDVQPTSSGGARPAVVSIQSGVGDIHQFAWLFRSDSFLIQLEDVLFILKCPTHLHGNYHEAATVLLEAAEKAENTRRAQHICGAEFSDGVHVFGQCIEEFRANVMDNNARAHTSDWLDGLLDLGDELKRAAEPGIYSALLSHASQLPGATAETAGLAELRITSYAAIVSGAKTLYYRPSAETEIQGTEFIDNELMALRPWLGIADPLDLVRECSSNSIAARTLVCGDKAVLLVLFNRNFPVQPNDDPCKITIDTPSGLKPAQCVEIGGTGAPFSSTSTSTSATITVPGVDSVRSFILLFEPISN